jgi:hypothetical protein
MGMSALNHRHECDRCGGAPSRAVRSRKIEHAETAETVYYLAFTWACSVCGNTWIDDGLERMNAQAEQMARREAYEARHLARQAS